MFYSIFLFMKSLLDESILETKLLSVPEET